MRIYVYESEYGVVVVKELREDLARSIAEQYANDLGYEDIDLSLVEEFDGRDREVLYSTLEENIE